MPYDIVLSVDYDVFAIECLDQVKHDGIDWVNNPFATPY